MATSSAQWITAFSFGSIFLFAFHKWRPGVQGLGEGGSLEHHGPDSIRAWRTLSAGYAIWLAFVHLAYIKACRS